MNLLPALQRTAKHMWLVNTLGDPDDGSYEISIVREDYELGQKSFGWCNHAKIKISSGGKVPRPIWERLVIVATESAADLNAIDI